MGIPDYVRKVVSLHAPFLLNDTAITDIYVHGSYYVQEVTGVDVSAQDVDIVVITETPFEGFVLTIANNVPNYTVNDKMKSVTFRSLAVGNSDTADTAAVDIDVACRSVNDQDYNRILGMVNYYPQLFSLLESKGVSKEVFSTTFRDLRLWAQERQIYSPLYLTGSAISLLILHFATKDGSANYNNSEKTLTLYILKQLHEGNLPSIRADIIKQDEQWKLQLRINNTQRFSPFNLRAAYSTPVVLPQKTSNSCKIVAYEAGQQLKGKPFELPTVPKYVISFPSRFLKQYNKMLSYLFDYNGIRNYQPKMTDELATVDISIKEKSIDFEKHLDDQKKWCEQNFSEDEFRFTWNFVE